MKKMFVLLTLTILMGWVFAGNDLTPTGNSSGVPLTLVTLKGQVIDFNSGEFLTGVEVVIEGTDLKAYTDFDGNFEFKDVKPGNYNVIASYISYKNSLIENFKAEKAQNKVDIKLQTSK